MAQPESQQTRFQIAKASFRAADATIQGEFGCPFCGKADLAIFMGKVDFSAKIGSDDLLDDANVSLAAIICGKSHLFFVLEADLAKTLNSIAA